MFGLLEHKHAFVVVTAAIAITTSFYIIWRPSNSKKKRKKDPDNMEYFEVEEGQTVLLLWCASCSPESVKQVVESLSSKLGSKGNVKVEHVDRLLMSNHPTSSFDACVSGIVEPMSTLHSQDLLSEVLRIVKPSGWVFLNEPVVQEENGGKCKTQQKLQSILKLSGFVNISEGKDVTLQTEMLTQLMKLLDLSQELKVVNVKAQKPSYEVGASVQLSFAKIAKPVVDEKTAAVWSFSALDALDDDVDIIDSDMLLDEDDLKKPDPASLRVECGDGTKKKKACKNCSCGLADELEEDTNKPKQQSTVNSACGNCYLGDAFRCGSCPYLGMPAFKSGEKVQLSDRQMNPDL